MKHANTHIARGPCLVPLSYSLHDKNVISACFLIFWQLMYMIPFKLDCDVCCMSFISKGSLLRLTFSARSSSERATWHPDNIGGLAHGLVSWKKPCLGKIRLSCGQNKESLLLDSLLHRIVFGWKLCQLTTFDSQCEEKWASSLTLVSMPTAWSAESKLSTENAARVDSQQQKKESNEDRKDDDHASSPGITLIQVNLKHKKI